MEPQNLYAVVCNAKPVCVCAHPEHGYFVLTVGVTCCETKFSLARDEATFYIRRFREDSGSSEDDDDDDDLDDEDKWLDIKPAFILLLQSRCIATMTAPDRHAEHAAIRSAGSTFSVKTDGGSDTNTTTEELLTLVRALYFTCH